jgi:hypothetical protein
VTPIIQPQQQPGGLVEALKNGLLQLEIDRVQGSIPDDEYVAAKPALEHTIQWALTWAAARREIARQELSRDVSHTSAA